MGIEKSTCFQTRLSSSASSIGSGGLKRCIHIIECGRYLYSKRLLFDGFAAGKSVFWDKMSHLLVLL